MTSSRLETTLILGRGEVGNSLYQVLKNHYSVWCEDTRRDLRVMKDCPITVDVLHVCIRYGADFEMALGTASYKYKPRIINICTTLPPDIMDRLEKTGDHFCHSTTRGLHPNLSESLKLIPKHIGGARASELAQYFDKAGVPCVTHARARTTALLHILNNVHYGVNLIFADEAAKLCRRYGVDYFDYLLYTKSNNDGYADLGHATKVRPILTPPGGKIGGHCVTHSATLIPEDERPDLFNRVAAYNE